MVSPRALGACALLGTLALAGCSGSSSGSSGSPYSAPAPSTTAATPAPAAAAPAISIKSFSFTPHVLTVKRGTAVTVTNNDSTTHTWTSTSGAFDSGQLDQGKAFTFTFGKAGTFSYVCSIHPSMTGSVVVTP
jgi:plastocyanin